MRPRTRVAPVLCALATAVLASCGHEDVRHAPTVQMTVRLSGFLGHTDWAFVRFTIFQLSAAEESARAVPAGERYEYDVFSRIEAHGYSNDTSEMGEPLHVQVSPLDEDANGRTDLRFVIQRSSPSRASFDDTLRFTLETEAWRRDALSAGAPPPFRVRADIVDVDSRVLATTGRLDTAANTLFARDTTLDLPPLRAP